MKSIKVKLLIFLSSLIAIICIGLGITSYLYAERFSYKSLSSFIKIEING